MEPLFINKFRHTKESYIEMNMKYSQFTRIFFGIIFFAALGVLSVFGYFILCDLLYTVVFAVLAVGFAFYPTVRIYLLARKREKVLLEMYGVIPENIIMFSDENIMATSLTNKAETKLEYSRIKRIKQSRNMYLLILSKGVVLMVDKMSFEKGNCEEFEKFIKEKAINAKIRL